MWPGSSPPSASFSFSFWSSSSLLRRSRSRAATSAIVFSSFSRDSRSFLSLALSAGDLLVAVGLFLLQLRDPRLRLARAAAPAPASPSAASPSPRAPSCRSRSARRSACPSRPSPSRAAAIFAPAGPSFASRSALSFSSCWIFVLASATCFSLAAFSFSSCCRYVLASPSWLLSLSLSAFSWLSLTLACARSSTSLPVLSASAPACDSASACLRSGLGLLAVRVRLLLLRRRPPRPSRPSPASPAPWLGRGGRGFLRGFLLRRLLGRRRRLGLAQIADGRRIDVLRLRERRLDRLRRHRRRNLHRRADVERLGEVAHARLGVLVLVDLEDAEQDVDLRHDPVRREAALLGDRDRLLQLAPRLVEVAVLVGGGGALIERLQLLHRLLGVGRAGVLAPRPASAAGTKTNETIRLATCMGSSFGGFAEVSGIYRKPALRGRSGRHILCTRRRKGWGRRAPARARGSTARQELPVVGDEQHRPFVVGQGPHDHVLGSDVEVVRRLI